MRHPSACGHVFAEIERVPTRPRLDLVRSDPWPEVEVLVNVGHASTSRAVAQEADHFDDLAYLGKVRAGVLVELVDRIRAPHGEPYAVVTPRLGHNSTMAG